MRERFQKYTRPLNNFQKQWLQLRRVDIFLHATMRNSFEDYMQGPQWHSKAMTIAERGRHLPQCCYAKSISKVHAALPQWFSKTMSIAEKGWYFPPCRYAKSFSRVYARPSMTSKKYDYSWEGLTFTSMPLCEIVFKRTFGLSMILENNDYSGEGWYFPPCRYAKSFQRVYARPSMTFKNHWL